MACVDCKDNIINKTPSLIGEPKCGSDCPPETTCDEGYIASTCVYYSGNNLACTEINYGDTLSEVIQQLDSKYGVRVTDNDNCCGFLNDKVVAGEGITKEIVIVDGCEKLQLTANCQELEWLDILLTDPYYACISPSGLPETQTPQYAVDPCNGKVWLRGTICIPLEVYSETEVFRLPVFPLSGRVYANVFFRDSGLITSFLIITNDSGSGLASIPPEALDGDLGYILLDGYSFETN
jgi:hypothetical protein